jgi:protein TonB
MTDTPILKSALAALRATLKFRGLKTTAGEAAGPQQELRLLVAWTNPRAAFAGNLADRLRGRVVPGLVTTSAPDHGFWHGVDLRTPFPRRGLLDSAFAHAALLGLLYAISIWPQSSIHLADPLSRRTLHGYTISPYLPELHGAPTHPRASGKPDPVLAKQEILSLPETPDNLHQTIVAPPKIKLKQDVDLPNLVTYQTTIPVQPLAASERASAKLRLPNFMPEVIRPAVDSNSLRSRSKLPAFQPQVVEPAPEVAQANLRHALPAFQPNVVEPAPDLGHVSRGTTAVLAHLSPRIAEPIPEAPHMPDAQHLAAQIIALNLHPADVQAPVQLPSGNRQGAFAASPAGHAEASGTPGAGLSNGAGTHESKTPVNAPAGITVAAAPAPGSPVATPNAKAAPADPEVRAKFMAAMHPPAISIPAHQPIARESTAPRTELENRIFAGRRSYTLSVNMPNLNTATGSWIIHFVERNADRDPGSNRSPIAAPEVVSKFDPAYPGDLIQDGVQGNVVLTATIRADGSVGDIAVAKSLDPRLDQNASEALSHWLFRPALRDGRAIALEAVITVPFHSKVAGFR